MKRYILTTKELQEIGWLKGTKVTGTPCLFLSKCVNIEDEKGRQLTGVPLRFLEETNIQG